MNVKNPKLKTHFGFEQIDSDLKSNKVREIFDNVVEGYDLMNDLMSFGIHRIWKRIAVEMSEIRSNSYILDLAGGTGDMVKMMVPKLSKEGLAVLSDINENMLVKGRDKLIDSGITDFNSAQIDAQLLPFKKDCFDIVSIAFGLRNVTDKKKSLSSILECLKPGGKLVVLEFSKPKSKFIGFIFKLYFHYMLPRIASFFSRSDAYRYLPESVDFFPSRHDICRKIIYSGFQRAEIHDLTFGISTIFLGCKDEE